MRKRRSERLSAAVWPELATRHDGQGALAACKDAPCEDLVLRALVVVTVLWAAQVVNEGYKELKSESVGFAS